MNLAKLKKIKKMNKEQLAALAKELEPDEEFMREMEEKHKQKDSKADAEMEEKQKKKKKEKKSKENVSSDNIDVDDEKLHPVSCINNFKKALEMAMTANGMVALPLDEQLGMMGKARMGTATEQALK